MGDLLKWKEQPNAWSSMPRKMLKKNNNEPKRGKSDQILIIFCSYSTFFVREVY